MSAPNIVESTATKSIEWATVIVTEQAVDPGNAYATTLFLSDSPVATVYVLAPTTNGIMIPPNNVTISPGSPTTTIGSNILVSVKAGSPVEILFQTAVPSTTPVTPPSTTASLIASPTLQTSVAAVVTTDINSVGPGDILSVSTAISSVSGPSPSTQPKSTKASAHLSAASVAGVAIGCLVAGALLAGFILWICCGKRRTSRKSDPETHALKIAPYGKEHLGEAIPPESGLTSAKTIDTGLSQPLEDKTISGEISRISNSIKNHVQSYYHAGHVDPELIDHDDIRMLGSNMPISVETLSALLDSSTTRELALRFCIAWAIISKIQKHSNGLLPSEVIKCLQPMASVSCEAKAHNALLGRWRAMTAALLEPTYVRNAFMASDSRNSSIRATVGVLDNVLQPYANSRMENDQRRHNLEEIVKRAAAFAFALFSQPSSWDFDWREKQSIGSGELCIFPALLQVTDETGEFIRPPRPFNESVVRSLDI
ncbi:hypothetical protein T440DRAFT_48602 [Plenodomus tracheiphilus IPT5]|uniref:Uncharacterized protein n=1 Tax=Plenodomus tracheiphilus IPT5 TaxID=1408161 RepID=A0A6A7B914_9PLEO|nr:hypothetical protein T440DRAFT_48602 [Plenodomus tracheiphilus IPT5]